MGVKVIPGSLVSGGAGGDVSSCESKLDRFALTACQRYNLGNAANWFFSFRMGMSGARERLLGLRGHSAAIHDWRGDRNPIFYDHHIVVMLFCMDSAIECFTFMLNALGQAFDKEGFRDVTTDKGLRGISPRDIVGVSPKSGYGKIFPSLQRYWRESEGLLELIAANHDLTKHRQAPPVSTVTRQDPPPGYFEAMGLVGDSLDVILARGDRTPLKTVSLSKKPKLPVDDPNRRDWTTLEKIEQDFAPFIPKSFCLALEDALAKITLSDPTLHR